MTQLKVGIYLPSFAYREDGIDHADRLRTWIVRAEELGFDSLWVTDHMLRAREMYARPWLEPLATLAFAAALTRRVLLGPGVLLLPWLLPAWARTGSPGLRADLPTLTGPDIHLTVAPSPFTVGGRTGHAVVSDVAVARIFGRGPQPPSAA